MINNSISHKISYIEKHCAVTAKQQDLVRRWRQPFHWHCIWDIFSSFSFFLFFRCKQQQNDFSVILLFFVYLQIFSPYTFYTIENIFKPEKKHAFLERLCFNRLLLSVFSLRERTLEGSEKRDGRLRRSD